MEQRLFTNDKSSVNNNKSNFFSSLISIFFILVFFGGQIFSQGSWTPLATPAPDYNCGVMLLLSDGTVLVKTLTDPAGDSIGNTWDKLTPDINGSYVNGTWSAIAPMADSRLYFSSCVLRDGRVYIAGGEYGSGSALGEVYDPLADTWTPTPTPGGNIGDANSELLPDGKVLQSFESGSYTSTYIYDPLNNTYTVGPTAFGDYDESAWLKLPDNSILYVDIGSSNSERYIPSLSKWVQDATVPVSLYDPFGSEAGAGFLLPDGRAFFLGSTGHTAYYTASGDSTMGVWSAGPDIPDTMGTPDAAAAMMVNGKILCAVSPVPVSGNVFQSPLVFYEFDYLSNSFTKVMAPGGGDSTATQCYNANLLDLPDGTVLYGQQYSPTYYVYTPDGAALSAGKPSIDTIIQNNCTAYTITGKLFNGISEGAAYGDDWQMATNYPIVRLTYGSNVYYARTSNWNRTGVQTGTLADTAQFTLPDGFPVETYSLVVTANGISSDPVTFTPGICLGTKEIHTVNTVSVFPNPADKFATLVFSVKEGGSYLISVKDLLGRTISEENYSAIAGDNSHPIGLDGISKGVYFLTVQKGQTALKTKLMVE